MGLVLGKVGEDVPMLLALLLKLVGEVAVLVLGAVAVPFGVGLASPALPVVFDGVELPHIIMFLKLRSKISHLTPAPVPPSLASWGPSCGRTVGAAILSSSSSAAHLSPFRPCTCG